MCPPDCSPSLSQKPEHFPLPASLTAKLARAKRDLMHGRGFSLISGGWQGTCFARLWSTGSPLPLCGTHAVVAALHAAAL